MISEHHLIDHSQKVNSWHYMKYNVNTWQKERKLML